MIAEISSGSAQGLSGPPGWRRPGCHSPMKLTVSVMSARSVRSGGTSSCSDGDDDGGIGGVVCFGHDCEHAERGKGPAMQFSRWAPRADAYLARVSPCRRAAV